MSLYVSQAKIKGVAAAGDQSVCPKGSASGLTATRSLYIIFFPPVLLIEHIHCCDRLNFGVAACGTYVRECNGKERISKEKQKLKVSLHHFKQCMFLLRCLILRNESFSSPSAVISRLNFALL